MEFITFGDWTKTVTESSKLTVVLFVRPGEKCCEAMQDALDSLEIVADGQVSAYKVDVYAERILSQRFRASIVPTIMIFKGWQKLFESICYSDRSAIESAIKKYI